MAKWKPRCLFEPSLEDHIPSSPPCPSDHTGQPHPAEGEAAQWCEHRKGDSREAVLEAGYHSSAEQSGKVPARRVSI